MKLSEFTKITGYSPVTVAQALLYKPESRAAKLALYMGVNEPRDYLVSLAISKKARAKCKKWPVTDHVCMVQSVETPIETDGRA